MDSNALLLNSFESKIFLHEKIKNRNEIEGGRKGVCQSTVCLFPSPIPGQRFKALISQCQYLL